MNTFVLRAFCTVCPEATLTELTGESEPKKKKTRTQENVNDVNPVHKQMCISEKAWETRTVIEYKPVRNQLNYNCGPELIKSIHLYFIKIGSLW